MRCMRVGVGCINAAAVQELVEQLFIGSLVDGLIAFGALQIACGLLKLMNIRCGGMFLLELKQRGNAAGPSGFLPYCSSGRQIGFGCWCCELGTVFLEPFFNQGCRQPLVNPGLACVALVAAAMGLPLVLAWLPRLLALSYEGLLPLFGLVGGCSAWFGVQIVLLVFEDLGQAGCRMCVDLQMILVEDALPGFFLRVVDAGGPLPCSEGCISLALS